MLTTVSFDDRVWSHNRKKEKNSTRVKSKTDPKFFPNGVLCCVSSGIMLQSLKMKNYLFINAIVFFPNDFLHLLTNSKLFFIEYHIYDR